MLILVSSTFMGLICGTLYLYSSFSPQLALRLNYSATNASTIALLGSLGIAISGPLAGVVVDKRGYTFPLLAGGTLITLGYWCLRQQYVSGLLNLALLCSCLFLIGCGSTFINLVCMKCCAVTFPKIRGVATSLPLALYGLLAMFYSVVASRFYPGDTPGFLKFLLVSVLVIFSICSPAIVLCDQKSFKPRVASKPIELISLDAQLPTKRPPSARKDNASTTELLCSPRFWILFFITGAISSLGQMYIYSIGYIVKALITKTYHMTPALAAAEPVDTLIQLFQQTQVGLISISNCVGRLAAGVMGDVISQSFKRPRSWLLFLPSLCLIFTQHLGHTISSHENLAMASVVLGFCYGYTLCIMPIIVGDVFGMSNFSRNWGFIGLAPVAPSMFFTSFFGKIYDSHTSTGADGVRSCIQGNACYNRVFSLTLGMSLLAFLSVGLFNMWNRVSRLCTERFSKRETYL